MGGQVPFTSLNSFTDFSEEGRMINFALLKALDEGLGNGETSIFPIVIFKVKDGVNYSDEDFYLAINNIEEAIAGKLKFKAPNFDLFIRACQVAAKRLFPTFEFLDATFNQHEKWDINDPNRFKYETATMGCRTRVFENINGEKTSFKRGNLSFTTIGLVKPAIESYLKYPDNEEKRIEYYFELIDWLCEKVKDQLLERFEFQCEALACQFPFMIKNKLWMGSENLNSKDEVREMLKNGTLGISYFGLAEALKMLIGKHHGESEKAQELGLKIIKFMRQHCDNYKQQYHLNFGLFATPAEGLSGKFTKLDRKKYGIIPGVTDRLYYTNSCHVAPYYPITAYDKIRIEAPYHELSNAGHILYVEMDTDAQKNLPAFMSIIKQMKDNNVGYGAINVPSCKCLTCGYDKPFEDKCPICGETENIIIIKRISGYLVGDMGRWNSAKKAEAHDRVKHI